ncbi:WxL domain-containing protein [Enterococcus faecalis]|uniref:WxL domain-containing protein n=1 Tax=Enterococcus faecalis TaxID=1351 RepID=UPI0021C58683|nr:WxL domain-containing protein [Enterococcus faecalis]MCU2243125.1 WxL domain-containing protein [Enterococcus faecalis]
MKSMKLTNALLVAVIAGGIGFSSIYADAVAPQNSTGKVTFTAGDLTLDKVPSFDFGTQQITAQDHDYDAQAQSEVQVTDLRGSSAGWTLTVTAGKLKAGMKELTGAQVSLANGVVTNSSDETVTASDASLIPEQSVKVMNAAAGNGNGVTTGNWQTTDVKLHVPGATAKSAEQYTTDLTWTLTDAPAS